MLWFKKRPDPAAASGNEAIVPAVLSVALDPRIFAQKFVVFLEMLGESGGVEPYLEALANKSRLFQGLLNAPAIEALDREKVETLLETVMPARKRLGLVLAQMDESALVSAVSRLLYGEGALEDRMNAFVDAMPVQAETDVRARNKMRRAGWDFGAELLHFSAPDRYPLMTRWVWDQATLSGAMRELLRGGDTLNDIPFGMSPGVYEAGRVWVAQQMAEQGVYRDPHFAVDLFLAHAYADYMRAMSSGMGLMNADFGGKSDPIEPVKKLLGIDATRRSGESRVKKATLH